MLSLDENRAKTIVYRINDSTQTQNPNWQLEDQLLDSLRQLKCK